MHVITENICLNSINKNIPIHPSPIAKFDVNPFLGASPLKVQFTDRSQGADTLFYQFSQFNVDGSTKANPSYTYYEIGKDLATQIAKNNYGCSDTATQSIEVVVPVYDITLVNVKVDVMDEKLKLKVGIQNNGTIIINNPVVRIDVAEKVSINHKIETALMPGAYNEYLIDFEVLKKTNEPLDYMCFSLEQSYGAELEDVTPFDNSQCISIDNAFNVLDPFPNPSSQYVDVPVILPNTGNCDFKMVGEQGNIVYTKQFANLNSGLNVIRMDLAPYRKGFYLLTVKLSESEITKKIIIQ